MYLIIPCIKNPTVASMKSNPRQLLPLLLRLRPALLGEPLRVAQRLLGVAAQRLQVVELELAAVEREPLDVELNKDP